MAILTDEVTKLMKELPEDAQRRVLEYTRSLRSRPRGLSGKELVERFAGTISHEDAEEMRRAIAEDCERIDPDGW